MPLSHYILHYFRRGFTFGGFAGALFGGSLLARGYLGRTVWSFAVTMGIVVIGMIMGIVVADCLYWRRHKTIIFGPMPREAARDLPGDSV